MEGEGADVGQEGGKSRSADASAKTFDEGGILLQGRVEGFADGEDIYASRRSEISALG